MRYSISQESRIGGRAVNQDRAVWLATEDAVLMVVADGMGGHMHGEVAAQLAVDIVAERFRSEAQPRLADPATFLGAALRQAHRGIVRHATDCSIPSHAAPRTTCIACVVQDGTACWAHAGDSRLYLVHGRGGRERTVTHTRDHSVVQRMIDDGMLDRTEAAQHPMRNRVFSCLGGSVEPQIEVATPVMLRDGDLIALCTDGAWSPLGESLAAELARSPLTSSVPHLLDAAERAAGADADNLTLIAMRWEESEGTRSESAEPRAALRRISNEEVEQAIAELRSYQPHASDGVHS